MNWIFKYDEFTTFLNQSLMNAIHISNALFKNYYSSDNDFIRAGLGGMGYNHRSYKKDNSKL
jgi:hypothetical protein